MRSALVGIAALLLHCAAAAATPEEITARQQDRRAYLAVLHAPQTGPSTCATIQTQWLAEDCALFAAESMVTQELPMKGLEACESIEDRNARGRCLTWVVAETPLLGEQATKACRDAAADRGRCQNLALTNTLAADASLPVAVGEEGALAQAIAEQAETMLGKSRQRHLEREAQRHLLRTVSMRWSESPFRVELCGALPTEQCQRAYVESVVEAGIDLDALCAEDREPEALRAAGLPAWAPEDEPVVFDAIERLCTPADHPAEATQPG